MNDFYLLDINLTFSTPSLIREPRHCLFLGSHYPAPEVSVHELGTAQSLSPVIERMLCLLQAPSEQVQKVKSSLGNAEKCFFSNGNENEIERGRRKEGNVFE